MQELTGPTSHRISFAMASDLGATPVQVEFVRGAANGGYPVPYRQVWYARYIDWTITTPMLLLELLLTTGLPLSQIFIVRLRPMSTPSVLPQLTFPARP